MKTQFISSSVHSELFWELEGDLLAGELLVDVGIGLKLVLNVGLHGLVEVDLKVDVKIQLS